MVGVMRRKKGIAPAVIEKILCDGAFVNSPRSRNCSTGYR